MLIVTITSFDKDLLRFVFLNTLLLRNVIAAAEKILSRKKNLIESGSVVSGERTNCIPQKLENGMRIPAASSGHAMLNL